MRGGPGRARGPWSQNLSSVNPLKYDVKIRTKTGPYENAEYNGFLYLCLGCRQ